MKSQQTINRYSYREPCFKSENEVNDPLNLEKSTSSCLRIFRLLSGTCTLKDEFFNKSYVLRTNYLKYPYKSITSPTQSEVLSNFPDEVSKSDIASYFKSIKHNEDLYKLIESELVNCLIAKQNHRNLEAFLFLYRVLEGISYSLPLVYVSKMKSYKSSFTALRTYLSKNSSDGEIKFFKKFVSEVFSDEQFFQLSIDINLNDIEIEELRSKYFKIYRAMYKNIYKKNLSKYILSEIEDEELSVSFLSFFDFMIEIRNRYFHFLQGTWHDNISTSKVIYPDLFFKPIIDHGVNWISLILFGVINFDFEQQST